MKMTVTLETIHKEIQQVKGELHVLRSMLNKDSDLTNEARRELEKARKETAKGEYISHEEIMAKHG